MVRRAATGFVVSMLLTTVAALLMLSGTVHAQRVPRHVFSGAVRNAGTPVHQGQVSFLNMSSQEVATGNISGGRYKISVVEPVGRNYSGQAFKITVAFGDRIYEREPGRHPRVNWQAGGVTVLDLEIGAQAGNRSPGAGGWRWHQAPPPNRRQAEQQQNNQDRDQRMEMERQRMERENEDRARRMKMDEQRMERERQRREMEEEMRREQMEMERQRMGMEGDMRQKEGEERRKREGEMRREKMEMERQRMEREDKMREKEGEERREMERQRMERERQRMEREDKMREKEGEERREIERQRMEREWQRQEQMERQRQEQMERQRQGRGQPGGVRPVGKSPKSGPSRGLFSNRAAGEAISGIDNIMDPIMLTIIGIALTVLTTGMTLFKGN